VPLRPKRWMGVRTEERADIDSEAGNQTDSLLIHLLRGIHNHE
jgi:hypothetical protein